MITAKEYLDTDPNLLNCTVGTKFIVRDIWILLKFQLKWDSVQTSVIESVCSSLVWFLHGVSPDVLHIMNV